MTVTAKPRLIPTEDRNTSGLAPFLMLAFAITWVLVGPVAASHQGWISANVGEAWHWLGALGPLGAAWWVGHTTGGLAELRRGIARWRVSPWFYLAALSPALLLVPAALWVRVADGGWPDLGTLGSSARLGSGGWVMALLVPAVAYGIGEEVGWRGFALPRLQGRYRPLTAALILGVIWVGWHIPFYLYRDGMVDAPVGEQFAQGIVIIIGGLFLAWLYNSTGGSILLCAIWHFTHSIVHVAIPEVSPTWDTYTGVFGTVLALTVTAIWWRRMSVSDTHVHGNDAQNLRRTT